ncbi:homoserine kinase [Brevibacillus sp. SYP-B805]|uniref:homoserine kinase n=1 Tax=Brevibacillus sp. SYP-B805 TaxID=1578199 RepID=UPI0013ED5433|nr:homoserine kinase [Brevibacillus sp. SYP-B805]NGQ94283.1 homoserine kinase [Brevibacillus sp. SYP-B805]
MRIKQVNRLVVKGSVRVRVPASTANLGPGFDAIGMAFQLYTDIAMQTAEETTITLKGEELGSLPADKSNLLYQTAARLFQLAGLAVPELSIEVETQTPLTRGLGSSASAIVGALTAANLLAGEPFSREELFAIATEMEGHPDNVGASLFGGIIVATMPEAGSSKVPYVRFSVPAGLNTLAVIPDYWLSTDQARHVLPESYSRADLVYNVGHSSLLVAALAQGRLDLLATAMRDRIHQPYRAPLVPGMAEMLAEATDHGALGAALSGAGPTTLFFYAGDKQKESLLAFIEGIMAKYRISYRAMELPVDEHGVRILQREP